MRSIPLLLLTLAACDPGAAIEHDAAPQDAGSDAGRDSGQAQAIDSGAQDASQDAGAVDSGADAGVDSGQACECSSGPCCDGCSFRAAGTPCGVEHVAYDDLCTVTPVSGYPKNSTVPRTLRATYKNVLRTDARPPRSRGAPCP